MVAETLCKVPKMSPLFIITIFLLDGLAMKINQIFLQILSTQNITDI